MIGNAIRWAAGTTLPPRITPQPEPLERVMTENPLKNLDTSGLHAVKMPQETFNKELKSFSGEYKMNQTIKVGILGMGRAGLGMHAREIADTRIEFELVAIAIMIRRDSKICLEFRTRQNVILHARN